MRREIEALTDDDVDKRDELEETLLELLKIDEFGEQRIIAYQNDHKDLERQPDTIVLSLDFTSSQTSMSDDFNDCIVVIATQAPLIIPSVLSDHLIAKEKPSQFLFKARDDDDDSEELERPKKARRTKDEMLRDNIQYPKPKPNLNSDLAAHRNRLKTVKVTLPFRVLCSMC